MRTFIGFGQVAYIGQPYTRPIKLGNISGVVIPLLFQWISYGASTIVPNINVGVDFDNAICRAMDQVRSVYIDNLGSEAPVYVNFPDTNYTVVAKPNSEGWYPAFTNSRKCSVIGEGFLTGNIPQTYILLCNIPQQAAVNVEIDNAVSLLKASPVITRGNSIYNSNFGVPALGDQFYSSSPLSLIGFGNTQPLWNTPYSSGFLYITNLQFNVMNLKTNNGGGDIGACVIESTGVAGILVNPIYFASDTQIPQSGVTNVINLSAMQLKLDATQTWRIRVVTAVGFSGLGQVHSTFTQNPT